jgi:hypothetical protein
MTLPIKLFAVEQEPRSFDLTSFTLSNGFQYSGILLYQTHAEAQKSINDDLAHALAERDEEGLDEDDDDYRPDDEIDEEMGSVAAVHLHEDGSIFDDFGFNIAAGIGLPNDQTEEQVKEHVAQYYQHALKGIKKQHHQESDGPGF